MWLLLRQSWYRCAWASLRIVVVRNPQDATSAGPGVAPQDVDALDKPALLLCHPIPCVILPPFLFSCAVTLEPGRAEPELCFSRSQVREPAYALLDSGATHVLFSGNMLPKGARAFDVTINLAVKGEMLAQWSLRRRPSTSTFAPWTPGQVVGHQAHLGEWPSPDAVSGQEHLEDNNPIRGPEQHGICQLDAVWSSPMCTMGTTSQAQCCVWLETLGTWSQNVILLESGCESEDVCRWEVSVVNASPRSPLGWQKDA